MRSLSHLIIVVLTVSFFTIPNNQVKATNCHNQSSWKNGKTPDAQGRIHATVYYSAGATPSTTVKQLMEQAVEAWNALSCVSGVYFDEVSSGGDLQFYYTTDETDTGAAGCSQYKPSSDRIYWGENFKYRVSHMSATQARAVFEHELGHFLGLDEHSGTPYNIMNQGADCASLSLSPWVSQSDALDVKSCLSTVPACASPSPTPTPTPTPTPPPEDVCSANGSYWNFSSESCHSTVQACPLTCIPDEPGMIEEGGTYVGRADYCKYSTGCSYGAVDRNGCCYIPSPVVIDVNGNGFNLTDAANGVDFDIAGAGHSNHISWTSAGGRTRTTTASLSFQSYTN